MKAGPRNHRTRTRQSEQRKNADIMVERGQNETVGTRSYPTEHERYEQCKAKHTASPENRRRDEAQKRRQHFVKERIRGIYGRATILPSRWYHN